MTDVNGSLHLNLESQRTSLSQLQEEVERFGTAQDWPYPVLFQIQLVLEELACNVIDHGYGEAGHEFQISISSTPNDIIVQVTDGAKPYNPLEDTPEADVESALEDRAVGGMGVHLVREMADELHYSRDNGRNRLRFVKRRSE